MHARPDLKYPRRLIWSVVISDVLLINVAFLLAYYLRYEAQLFRPVDPVFDNPPAVYLPLMILLTLLLVISFKAVGMYTPRRLSMWLDQMYAIVRATPTSILLMIGITLIFQPFFYSRLIFLYAGILIVVLLGVSRVAWSIVLAQLRKYGQGVSRVLVIGAGDVGRTVIRTVMAQPEFGYRIVAVLDDRLDNTLTIGPIPAIEGTQHMAEVIAQYRVDEVVIALPWSDHRRILDIFQECERLEVRARTVPDLFQLSLNRVDVEDLGGVPLIGLKPASITGANLVVKRVMDIVLGSLIMIVALPIMAIIALAIKIDSPGPAIFKQMRVGLRGKEFVLYKFRSMRIGAEEEHERMLVYNEMTGPLFKMRDDPRRTRMGRFLRKTSFDELPQLFNVFKGDMSLVGPRPHMASEVAQYQAWQKQVLEAPPGLAGLAQVSGRAQLSFDEQCLLDIYYIENWSPALDLKILLRMIPKVLSGEGAY